MIIRVGLIITLRRLLWNFLGSIVCSELRVFCVFWGYMGLGMERRRPLGIAEMEGMGKDDR
jgi:hypothetical protein